MSNPSEGGGLSFGSGNFGQFQFHEARGCSQSRRAVRVGSAVSLYKSACLVGTQTSTKPTFSTKKLPSYQYVLANLTWHGIAVELDRMSDLLKHIDLMAVSWLKTLVLLMFGCPQGTRTCTVTQQTTHGPPAVSGSIHGPRGTESARNCPTQKIDPPLRRVAQEPCSYTDP